MPQYRIAGNAACAQSTLSTFRRNCGGHKAMGQVRNARAHCGPLSEECELPASPKLVRGIKQRDNVFRRHARLDIVAVVEHVAAAGFEGLQVEADMLAHFLG